MPLEDELHAMAMSLGADLYGIADLGPYEVEVVRQGGDLVSGYQFAISVGIRLLDAIVDQIPNRSQRAVRVSYRSHTYNVVNDRLDQISSLLAGRLQKEGFRSMPVPASERIDDERICAMFSHKMAAHLAGQGWIGKSCLLVTPQYGPRVRWTTVLTDYPFSKAGIPMDPRCGTCEECANACPMHAFTGRMFDQEEPREARFEARKCDQYFKDMEKQAPQPVCGMCVYICPYGRNIAKKAIWTN
ncbi:MAG: 4Fe-4S double cluster binding domain-containing protein [Methanomassiliicoccales archaeon]|jgi:epoxyqueuosine reductase QueG